MRRIYFIINAEHHVMHIDLQLQYIFPNVPAAEHKNKIEEEKQQHQKIFPLWSEFRLLNRGMTSKRPSVRPSYHADRVSLLKHRRGEPRGFEKRQLHKKPGRRWPNRTTQEGGIFTPRPLQKKRMESPTFHFFRVQKKDLPRIFFSRCENEFEREKRRRVTFCPWTLVWFCVTSSSSFSYRSKPGFPDSLIIQVKTRHTLRGFFLSPVSGEKEKG